MSKFHTYYFVICLCVCVRGGVWNVCVCEVFVMCGCFGNMYTVLWQVFLNLAEVFLTLTEVFPCFFLSCKANARVKLTKTGHSPHSSTLVVICVVRLLFVFYVLFVCKCVLPPGDNQIAVNEYININIFEEFWWRGFETLGYPSTTHTTSTGNRTNAMI